MTHSQQIAALNWEAVRRGISYGKLMISLTETEKESIYGSFLSDCEAKKAEDEKRAAKIRHSSEKVLINENRHFRPELIYSKENTEDSEIDHF